MTTFGSTMGRTGKGHTRSYDNANFYATLCTGQCRQRRPDFWGGTAFQIRVHPFSSILPISLFPLSPASEYVFDSTSSTQRTPPQSSPPMTSNGLGNGISEDLEEGTGSILAKRLQRVVSEAERKWRDGGSGGEPNRTTYLSGALSMALCCILLTVVVLVLDSWSKN